jgi:hypothetical protein
MYFITSSGWGVIVDVTSSTVMKVAQYSSITASIYAAGSWTIFQANNQYTPTSFPSLTMRVCFFIYYFINQFIKSIFIRRGRGHYSLIHVHGHRMILSRLLNHTFKTTTLDYPTLVHYLPSFKVILIPYIPTFPW